MSTDASASASASSTTTTTVGASDANTSQIEVDGLYRHADAVRLSSGQILFRNPERIPYEHRPDTVLHIAAEGETLQDLAIRYYGQFYDDPVDKWEVIAQFQPDGLVDGSVALVAGQEILIPSPEYIAEVVNGPTLAEFPVI